MNEPIPSHILKHKIELDTTICLSHQVHYHMNPNYVADLDKLLVAIFIELI